MKVIIAQSCLAQDVFLKPVVAQLANALTTAGHEVQRFDLPELAAPSATLPTLASHRMMRLEPWCDVLLCLDPFAAVLAHPRKFVWLLDTRILEPRDDGRSESAQVFAAKVVKSAVGEAKACFVPSGFAQKRIGQPESSRLLAPAVLLETALQWRGSGGELLLAEPLTKDSRVELLLQSLDLLPSRHRVRWLSPSADPASLLSARRLADSAGLADRVTFDVRPVGSGEFAHLLSSASALVTLEADALVVKPHLRSALKGGIPVIGMTDGGAIGDLSRSAPAPRLVTAEAQALADAIEESSAADPAKRLASAASKKNGHARQDRDGWQPLLDELAS